MRRLLFDALSKDAFRVNLLRASASWSWVTFIGKRQEGIPETMYISEETD